MSFSKLDALASVAELIGEREEIVGCHSHKGGVQRPGPKQVPASEEAGGCMAIHKRTVPFGLPDEQVTIAAQDYQRGTTPFCLGGVCSIPRRVVTGLALPMSWKAPPSRPSAVRGLQGDAAHCLSLSEPGAPTISHTTSKRSSPFLMDGGKVVGPVPTSKRHKAIPSAGKFPVYQSFDVSGVITAPSPMVVEFADAQPVPCAERAGNITNTRQRQGLRRPTAAAFKTAMGTVPRLTHLRARSSPVVSGASDDPCTSSNALVGTDAAAAVTAPGGAGDAARAWSSKAVGQQTAVISPTPTSEARQTAVNGPAAAWCGYRAQGPANPVDNPPASVSLVSYGNHPASALRNHTGWPECPPTASPAAAAAAGGADVRVQQGSAEKDVTGEGVRPQELAAYIARMTQSPTKGGPDLLEKMRIGHLLLTQRDALGPDLVNWVIQHLKDLCQSPSMAALVANMASSAAAVPKQPPQPLAASASVPPPPPQQPPCQQQQPAPGREAADNADRISASHRSDGPDADVAFAGLLSPRGISPVNSGSTAPVCAKQPLLTCGRCLGSSPPAGLERAGATATEDPTPARGGKTDGRCNSERVEFRADGGGCAFRLVLGSVQKADQREEELEQSLGQGRGDPGRRQEVGGARGGAAGGWAAVEMSKAAPLQPQLGPAQDAEANGSTSSSSSSSRTATHARELPRAAANGPTLCAGPEHCLHPPQETMAAVAGVRTGGVGAAIASCGPKGICQELDLNRGLNRNPDRSGGDFANWGQAAASLALNHVSGSQVPARLHGDRRGPLSLNDSFELNNAAGMLALGGSGQLPSGSTATGMEVDYNLRQHHQQQLQQLTNLLIKAGIRLRPGPVNAPSGEAPMPALVRTLAGEPRHGPQQQWEQEQRGPKDCGVPPPPAPCAAPRGAATAAQEARSHDAAGASDAGVTTAALIAALLQRGQSTGAAHRASEDQDPAAGYSGAALTGSNADANANGGPTTRATMAGQSVDIAHASHLESGRPRGAAFPVAVEVTHFGGTVGPHASLQAAPERWVLGAPREGADARPVLERVAVRRSDAGAAGGQAVQVVWRNGQPPQPPTAAAVAPLTVSPGSAIAPAAAGIGRPVVYAATQQLQPAGYDGCGEGGSDNAMSGPLRLQRQASLPSAGSYSRAPLGLGRLASDSLVTLGRPPVPGQIASDYRLRGGMAAYGAYPQPAYGAYICPGSSYVALRSQLRPQPDGKAAAVLHG